MIPRSALCAASHGQLQQLVTDPLWWPTRSYLKRIIDGEYEALDAATTIPAGEPAPEQ